MIRKHLVTLVLLVNSTISCVDHATTEIHKIYEYCGRPKTDAAVISKIKALGLEDEGDAYKKFYEPKSRTDYDFIRITLNPQPGYNDIQGIFITWKKSPGLNYEEIQKLLGIPLPKRGAKEIDSDQGYSNETRYIVLGAKPNPKLAPINQITVTCAKNSYDVCWEVKFACFDFVHPE